jgi:hypothetical protein
MGLLRPRGASSDPLVSAGVSPISRRRFKLRHPLLRCHHRVRVGRIWFRESGNHQVPSKAAARTATSVTTEVITSSSRQSLGMRTGRTASQHIRFSVVAMPLASDESLHSSTSISPPNEVRRVTLTRPVAHVVD